ncbi:hypothetical protein ACIA6D_42990 [Streptomyces cacaoi]
MAALDQASAGPVTITTASAGSGQSSLVRAWADRLDEGHHPAIVQVQRGARAILETLDAPRTDTGEIRNAQAVIRLAEGDPTADLTAVAPALDGTAPAVHSATVVEAQLLAAPGATGSRGGCRGLPSRSPSRRGWSCHS